MATVAPPSRLGPADHGRVMTLEAFADAEFEEGYRYELARGALEVSEVPDDPHGFVVFHFLCAIGEYHRRHPGRILRHGEASGFRLYLPGMISGRNPDLAVVLRGATKDPRGRYRPALAFEVVSEGAEARIRDYATKREEYLRYGQLEYWILDRFERKVTVLKRDGDAWIESVFADGQHASGLDLPGLAVAVSDLWALPEDDPHEGAAG